jgi:CopG family nickel-responsive transcriptional regulator
MKRRDEIVRLSISLPASLLSELDRRVIRRGYSSRSEFVRDLVRAKLTEDTWSRGKDEVVAVLTIGFDHHRHDVSERINEVQHHSHANVLCSTHVHLSHDECLEAIILRGRPEEIERLSLEIGGLKGVRFAGLTRASKGEPRPGVRGRAA